MNKRRTLSKKIRFEVFKRDGFKCQYCGRSAPDVILEVDHINPVSEGGSNDMLNLITSCLECNRGKGKQLLSENSILDKKRERLEELNERRLQIDMMMEWQEELLKVDDYQVEKLCNYIEKIREVKVNDSGKVLLKQYIKKYEFDTVLEAIQISFEQYEDVEEAFNKIPKIINNKKRLEEKPYLKDLYYIRGIAKNRFSYINEYKAIQLLEQAYLDNASIESLKEFTIKCRNWTQFKNGLEEYIKEYNDEEKNTLITLNISTNDIKELENSINSETNRIIEGLCQIIDIYVMELEREGYELLRGEEKDIDELLAYIQIKINTYEECKKVIKDIEIAWEVEIKKDENDNKYYIDIAADF